MLSAVIRSRRSYPAVLLAEQLAHQRSVHPGPLVLGAAPRTSPTPTADRDRTVSRRSEPSSRTTLTRRRAVTPRDRVGRLSRPSSPYTLGTRSTTHGLAYPPASPHRSTVLV